MAPVNSTLSQRMDCCCWPSLNNYNLFSTTHSTHPGDPQSAIRLLSSPSRPHQLIVGLQICCMTGNANVLETSLAAVASRDPSFLITRTWHRRSSSAGLAATSTCALHSQSSSHSISAHPIPELPVLGRSRLNTFGAARLPTQLFLPTILSLHLTAILLAPLLPPILGLC